MSWTTVFLLVLHFVKDTKNAKTSFLYEVKMECGKEDEMCLFYVNPECTRFNDLVITGIVWT